MSYDGEERFVLVPDGLRIHYRDYPAATAEAGPPVLCLHGLTRNARDFEVLAPMIAGLGRRVIVPSQRGRGLSDHDPKPERYNPAVYVADMLALLDHLKIAKAAFVGTSMGGLMTMIVATQAPGRVASAVLNDIGPEVGSAGIQRIYSYVGIAKTAASWDQAAELCRAANAVAFPKETRKDFWMAAARRTFREEAADRIVLDYDLAIAGAFRGGPEAVADLWPLFDALKPIPALVIQGELSDILLSSTVQKMQQRKPDLVAVQVPDVGHAPFMTEPAAWAALEKFLTA